MDFFEKITFVSTTDRRLITALLIQLIACMYLKDKKSTLYFLIAYLILYTNFGLIQTTCVTFSISLNLILLYLFAFNEYIFTCINLLLLYAFKIKGKEIDPDIRDTYDISGLGMLMVIRMSYVAMEFDRKKHSLLDVLGYILLLPGILVGPVPTFKEYINTEYKKPETFPWRSFLKSMVFLFSYQIVRKNFPMSILYEEKNDFLTSLFYLYAYNFGQRLKFYFAWNFSDGCYRLQGYDNMLNICFINVETATSIKDLSRNWNIKTNKWLKECFFDKLKHKGIFLASFLTFAVSALWHGINVCYLVMFLSFCIAIPIIKSMNKLMLKYCSAIYPILSRIQMLFFVMYFSIPFFLLDIEKLKVVWSSVYFYGHFYCLLGLLLKIVFD